MFVLSSLVATINSWSDAREGVQYSGSNLELVLRRGTEELERGSLGSQQAVTGRKTSALKAPEGYPCEGQTNRYRKGF